MSVKSALAAACMAALVAGCAASAPSGTAELPAQTAPAAQRQPALKSPGRHRARLVIRIRIPRRHRGHYVSAATKGMTLAFTGPTTTTESIGLTPASDPRCTGATTVACTISVGLLSGQYTATISTYDEAPVNGVIPPNANLLSTAKNVPFTIQPGIANTISFTLAGQIASLTVAALPSGTIGTAFATRFPFTVEALDADGYMIVGSYESPVTLSTSDTTGATAVTTSGSDSPPAGTLLSSWDVPYLNYTGAGIVPATISASATGATTGSGVFAPSPVLTAIGTTIGSAGAGVSETLTGHFAPGAMTVSVSGSGVTVSNVASTATQVTANFFIDPEAATGSRNVTVQVTGGGTSGAQGFTISNTGVVVVTLATDANPGTPPGTGTGTSGDLRYALLNAAAGDTIVFNTAAMCGASQCTITLGGPLPPIRQNQIIDGGEFGRVTIDGNSLYRAFWVDTGTVTIANLQVQNVNAQGGNGGGNGYGGGGGGAGLGGGLFVNGSGANATVVNDYFLNAAAHGGKGGGTTTGNCNSGSLNGSGGGGLGAAGGAGASSTGGGGGGGGGVLGAGTAGNGGTGGIGGVGGGGGGGPSGTAGAGFAGNSSGQSGDGSGNGGAGGFGGGGGGGNNHLYSGAAGGFGAGGGGAVGGSGGGAGGAGGGGGGATTASAGSGGGLATVSGGNGGLNGGGGGGGGGAAAGPAIFVNAGTLATTGSGASGSTATAGLGGGSCVSGSPGTADSTPVFNYGGTVNGSSTKGPIASALGGSAPALHRATRKLEDRRLHSARKP